MKNQQGNNMNQLFIPTDHNEENGKSYGVINNNYYYGPYTNINKLEIDNNQKISSGSSYENVSCAKILNKNNTNNKFNSTSNVSMPFMNSDLIQESLNTSKISEKSTRSINLNNSNSNLFINSMNYTNPNLPKPHHLLNNFPEKREIANYNKEPTAHTGYNLLGATSSNINTSYQKDLDNTVLSSKSYEISTNNLPCNNSSSPNTSSLFNIFNNLNNKESSIMKSNMYNYFYYKLFDFNGEDLSHLNSQSSYLNVSKVKLFKEDEGEKIKYEVMNDIDIQSVNSIDTEDSSCIRFENPKENCFGPQKNKISTKERNFKPY